MVFTGKAAYDAGSTFPEQYEDISPMVAMVSPSETPLLHALGDADRSAESALHEWIEDSLLPEKDAANGTVATAVTTLTVDNGGRFRVRDQVRGAASGEIMLVTAISTNDLTVTRGYGGTTQAAIADNEVIEIIGNASLEGDDAPTPRFQNRSRVNNYSQIFTETVSVSGTQQATRKVGVIDEVAYQGEARLRENLRYLERTILSGDKPASTPQGSDTVARSLQGMRQYISTHSLTANSGVLASMGTDLSEEIINTVLREIWDVSSEGPDLIVLGGFQKRRFNGIVGGRTVTQAEETAKNIIMKYESDYGTITAVMSRWVPPNSAVFLNSRKVQVMPITGRSFHLEPLAKTGDSDRRLLVGEYTMEFQTESSHAWVDGLAVA